MNTLEHVHYHSQLRQLRILAEAALTHYDLGNARLTLLAHRGDTVFRVTVSHKPAQLDDESLTGPDDMRFVLRLCDPAGLTVEMLQSELLWLSALRRETDLIVPEPIPTRKGAFVVEVAVEDIPEVRHCVLLSWVEGRFADTNLTPALFERVGTFMAHLHQHSMHFIPPVDFIRPRWDWNSYFERSTILDPVFAAEKCDGLITEPSLHLFKATSARVSEEIQSLPQIPDNYGLIHCDFQQTNYLFYKGNVRAIDFNDCCWGYYLFDMAITLSGVATRSDEGPMRKAFFKGYSRIQPLPASYEKYLKMFTALRIVKRVNYLFRSDDPQVRANAPAYLEYATKWLSHFVATKVRHNK